MANYNKLIKMLQSEYSHNKKWQLLFIIFVIFISFYSILILQNGEFDGLSFIDLLVTVIVDLCVVRFSFIVHKLNKIIVNNGDTEIILLNDIRDVNLWLNKNRTLLIKFALIPTGSSYYSWGFIETEKVFQLIFVNMSKSNSIVILDIDKKEISNSSYQKLILKWIGKGKREYERKQRSIRKYIFPITSFYEKL
ncbi:hypothetical protein FFRU_060820 [Fructobacillus fructosus]|uniref:hypothetical protein n=1 Tax=Fructobacillus fructosus TaxID=1631 RepID=UPI00021955E5|nr:hypothetical protein [Fructobacillus fructosus]GAP01356.1 hypothetical protein FFRU_060820 [Fructobacillus fructosus]